MPLRAGLVCTPNATALARTEQHQRSRRKAGSPMKHNHRCSTNSAPFAAPSVLPHAFKHVVEARTSRGARGRCEDITGDGRASRRRRSHATAALRRRCRFSKLPIFEADTVCIHEVLNSERGIFGMFRAHNLWNLPHKPQLYRLCMHSTALGAFVRHRRKTATHVAEDGRRGGPLTDMNIQSCSGAAPVQGTTHSLTVARSSWLEGGGWLAGWLPACAQPSSRLLSKQLL